MKTKRNKGVALIMAIAILCILSVVGFGFATSMKIARDATATIQNLVQARLAADSAIYYVQTMIYEDGIAEPTSIAGALSDHSGESLFSGVTRTESWKNLLVGYSTETQTHYNQSVYLKDELGKMNLHHGNISKWNYTDVWNDNSAGVATIVAANQLYNGANHGYSVYEVSVEEFFYQYYKAGYIWNSGQPYALTGETDKKARLRAANIARALCLYKYGGKNNTSRSDGEITSFGGDGKPGVAATDDNADNAFLISDGIDNDGDGTVDEVDEGIDDPAEYNPLRPVGNDARFSVVSEFRDAIANPFNIGITVPAAVNYTGAMSSAEIEEEADRLYSIFRDEISAYCPGPDALSVSIDDPGKDGYDNDGDGLIDASDTTGSTSIDGIKAQLQAGIHINKVNINESAIEPAAQAAYLYWKFAQTVTYKTAEGGTTTTQLLPHFTIQNAVDAVDYRDTDCVPTVIAADALSAGVPAADTYGFEGLHIGEVGRFICDGSTMTVADGTWAAASGTFTVSVPATEQRQSTLRLEDATNMKTGSYLVKCTIAMPEGGYIEFGSGQTATVNGEFYFGPFTAAANIATVTANAVAGAIGGTFQISDVKIILPYIDIMNFSRRARDMSEFQIKIGDGELTDILDVNTVEPAGGVWANGEALAKRYIGRLKQVAGGFDSANQHGAYYGHFVVTYNQASFDSWFADGSVGTRDFPICAIPTLFEPGFDGKQKVELYLNGTLVAGGVIDRFDSTFGTYTDAGGGFSSASNARCRVSPAGSTQMDAFYDAGSGGGASGPVEIIIDNLAGSPQVVLTGAWSASSFVAGYYETNYVHDGNVSKGAKSVRYVPTIPAAGQYSVYIYRAHAAGWANNAPIDVIHKNGTTTYTDNQTTNGFDWRLIGTFEFDAGTAGSLLIRTNGTTAYVVADAVKFYSDTIASGGAGATSVGRWKTLPDTVADYTKYWPADAAVFANEDVHLVTVGDRGYFRSPAELTELRVPTKYSTTISLAGLGDSNWDSHQPDISRIVDRVVTGRAPVKVNLNTAPLPLMKAVLCAPLGVSGYDAVTGAKPYHIYAYESGSKMLIGGTVTKDAATDWNEQNNGNDAGEYKQWAIVHSNLFTLKSTRFNAKVLGTVRAADSTVLARHTNSIIYIRGMSLDSSQKPVVSFEKTE